MTQLKMLELDDMESRGNSFHSSTHLSRGICVTTFFTSGLGKRNCTHQCASPKSSWNCGSERMSIEGTSSGTSSLINSYQSTRLHINARAATDLLNACHGPGITLSTLARRPHLIVSVTLKANDC